MRKEYAYILCFLVITLSKQTSALSQRGPENKVMGKHCLNTKEATEVLSIIHNEICIWGEIR